MDTAVINVILTLLVVFLQESLAGGGNEGSMQTFTSDDLKRMGAIKTTFDPKAKGSGWKTSQPPPQQQETGKKRPAGPRILSAQELMKDRMDPEEYEEMFPTPQDLQKLGKISTDPFGKELLSTYEGPTKSIKLKPENNKVSAYEKNFNDPLWPKQWYMQDYRDKDMPVMDLNVVPVWNMGITGKDVYVAVVDDGVTHGHPDLAPNHDIGLSFDYTKGIAGSQPDEPTKNDTRSHGTNCAGVIAMVPNNGLCGVGVAYGAKIIGVKSLRSKDDDNSKTTSYEDGQALVHKMDIVDISSNSYGDADDGKTPQLMTLTRNKFLNMGTSQGRGGKGTIYLFASGNGAGEHDTCGADATVNHIGVIAIGAAAHDGGITHYGETCSAVFGVTYSQGYVEDAEKPRQVVEVTSVDRGGGCTEKFTGTSASTPIAAGILALVIEAAKRKGNTISYRDAMHIIAMGAEVAPLANNGDKDESIWKRNGAGFWVSNYFGFGLLNAKNMVKLAENWQSVPNMESCVVDVPMQNHITVTEGSPATIKFEVIKCKVQWLESVQLRTNLKGGPRGFFEIALTSPAGTKTYVMENRADDLDNDMIDWVFKSVHTWGENPEGTWIIEVAAKRSWKWEDKYHATGTAESFTLTVYGLAGPPPYQNLLPRSYSAFRLTNGKTSHDAQGPKPGSG